MKEVYLKLPQEVAHWKAISKTFENLWDFPHCIGVIDGKHIAIESPGKHYFNVSLEWYCSQFVMQNIVLLMLTLVNMEVQTIVASLEVLVYIKRSRKTNSMCQLQRKLEGLKIHCPTFFLGTRYSRLRLG